jgi:hypothetical protein
MAINQNPQEINDSATMGMELGEILLVATTNWQKATNAQNPLSLSVGVKMYVEALAEVQPGAVMVLKRLLAEKN